MAMRIEGRTLHSARNIFAHLILYFLLCTCACTHTPPNLWVSFQPHRLPGSSCPAASALCRIPLSGHFCFSLFRVFKLQDTSNIHNLQRHILKAAKLGSESKQLQTHTHTQKKSRRDFTRSSTLFFSSFIRSALQKDVCLTLPASPL